MPVRRRSCTVMGSRPASDTTRRHRLYNAELVQPCDEWYGLDPIHIRGRHKPRAWRQILAPWRAAQTPELARRSLFGWVALRRLRPETRKMFGFEQRQVQPAGKLNDGSLVSLF